MSRSPDRPASFEPPRVEDFLHPIEFLFAEHDRQRVLCATLERIANDPLAPDAAENAALVLGYCEEHLQAHIADEETDLFPLLRRRCEPDDAIGTILGLLDEEHVADAEIFRRLVTPLRTVANGEVPADSGAFAGDARAFSILQRRHLSWENGTLLPLARRRLSKDDLAELGRRLATRRGRRAAPGWS